VLELGLSLGLGLGWDWGWAWVWVGPEVGLGLGFGWVPEHDLGWVLGVEPELCIGMLIVMACLLGLGFRKDVLESFSE
jgi:hypothetical protein